MSPGTEVALRAVGTALAGLSVAFASYMLAFGEGKVRVNGLEHLALFAQPRGAAAPAGPAPANAEPPVDLAATGSLDPERVPERPTIVAARPDRVWFKIDGAIRAAAPGDDVPGLGRIGAIIPRDGGFAVVDDKGATLLAVGSRANSAILFSHKRIFE
jgi:hypothetical protein